jgi:hypothetical protein
VKKVPGNAGKMTIVVMSNDRVTSNIAFIPFRCITHKEYAKPKAAITAKIATNLNRSLVKRKSIGFGYIIERTSWPFSVENPVRMTKALKMFSQLQLRLVVLIVLYLHRMLESN